MHFWRRRTRGDRGATLVEFAVVAPLIFFMLGGMFDIGLTVLGRSVASNAAREGARVGIINFENANIVASLNNERIKAAVDSKLVGLVKPDTSNAPYVAVRCLDGGAKTAKACTRAGIRVDYDLIEVTVKWRSISATGGTFTPSNLTNVARMVIVGDAGGGGVACLGSGGTIGFNPTSVSVTEGNSSTTATLTVTRTGSSCVTTVAYSTGPGDSNPATAGVDYTSVNSLITFFVGETSKTITIPILGDPDPEPNETFRVTLSNPVNGTIGAAGVATVTIVNDDGSADTTAPTVVSREYFDTNTDGKIDRIVVTYNEALGSYNGTVADWTLTNAPSGMGASPASVAISGSSVTLTWTKLSKDPDTGPANLQLTLGSGTAVRDVAGNFAAGFSNQVVMDRARPVPITIDVSNGGANPGRPEVNDLVTVTFSEPLDRQSVCANVADADWTNAALGQLNNDNQITASFTETTSDTLSATSAAGQCSSGLRFGSVSFNNDGYIAATVTFGGVSPNQTEVRWNPTTRQLVLVLGALTGSTTEVGDKATATYTADAGMLDLAGNGATGIATNNAKQF